MALMIGAGVHASPWDSGQPGAQVARAARFLLFGQVENGAQCPVTMTYASVPALRQAGAIARRMAAEDPVARIRSALAADRQKRGALIGMGMTEKQGGTDVRANTTRAEPFDPAEAQRRFGEEGAGAWRIVGHKWFFSAPQSDAHLILAQTEDAGSAGLSCFFVPRFLPDGSRNDIRVQRLKDKLGNRSNASSEVEFCGAFGWLVGQAGRGIPTILEMGSHTRLDCVLGSAGIMRAALTHALHHARGRAAFGRKLAEQPLMQNVLADLALESEAATAFALRLARCFDAGGRPGAGAAGADPDPGRQILAVQARPRLLLRGDGGHGRQRLRRGRPAGAPVPRGAGQLDLGRLGQRDVPGPAARVRQDAGGARGAGGRTGAGRRRQCRLQRYRGAAAGRPGAARRPTNTARAGWPSGSCIAVQAALLLRHAPPFVADAFVRSRVAQDAGGAYGRLPAGRRLRGDPGARAGRVMCRR